ncbi:hypothetical protein QAD02_023937 [Eretmocerus hayati]|uniref:Uncharacterized protein n=1 Tax=Eretmocerus hayati TaxID=131215 RepID=A0ACC2PXM2_9HYME|nr:hypothetical protein QAD02_023937 [Eretmocerus hayati]
MRVIVIFVIFALSVLTFAAAEASTVPTVENNSEKTTDAEKSLMDEAGLLAIQTQIDNSLYEAGPSNVRFEVQVEPLDKDHDEQLSERKDEPVCEAGTSMAGPQQSCCKKIGILIIICLKLKP